MGKKKVNGSLSRVRVTPPADLLPRGYRKFLEGL